jgi:AcrR family transcriptional regulator
MVKNSPMARPKDQQDRRNQMVDAAGRAIAERGLSNVRIKDIANQAGMSSGSVLYYYPELDNLLVEVHRETVERYYQQRFDVIHGDASPTDQLATALAAGIPGDPDDLTARLLYEMHALCEASTAHAELMSSLFEREVSLYISILEVGVGTGEFTISTSPDEVARVLVALEDGLGLHVVSRNKSMSPAVARGVLRRCAIELTGGSI